VHVRLATIEDLSTIAEIYNHAVQHGVATFDVDPVTLDERRTWFAQFDPAHPLFVCEVSAKVVGYAYYLPFRSKAAYARTKECTVYVAPDSQRRGVGSALYSTLIAQARASGVHTLIGVLGGENPASQALHRRFGFQEVGQLREVGFKFGRFVNTHYFQKLL
jgi:L-amino acid N-acyltransferase YncA